MSPEEDPKNEPKSVDTAEVNQTSEAPRSARSRRGRGRHHRRRKRPEDSQHRSERKEPETHAAETSDEPAMPPYQETIAAASMTDIEEEPADQNLSEETPVEEPVQPVAEFKSARPVEADEERPTTLQEAIEEVNEIIETLRRSLDDMEELLEGLEVLERQTNADQREIESLRRALRQLHRPREGSQGPRR